MAVEIRLIRKRLPTAVNKRHVFPLDFCRARNPADSDNKASGVYSSSLDSLTPAAEWHVHWIWQIVTRNWVLPDCIAGWEL